MIGVLCHDDEKEIVKEFFQLFKTPWEFFAKERSYQVVVDTLGETCAGNARLIVLYSSRVTALDGPHGIAVTPITPRERAFEIGSGTPIYGPVADLKGEGESVVQARSNAGSVARRLRLEHAQVVRVGYDLFREVGFLLSDGQPAEMAMVPTLESHIALLRDWIVSAGIPLVEIPPFPPGHKFIACLTHDVDFGGIRFHKLDHTMWGFVSRALLGSLLGFVRGTCSLNRLVKNWRAVLALPFVYLGILEDFWNDFQKYIEMERDLPSTFYLIPFKARAGDKVQGQYRARRATRYDINDVRPQVKDLINRGREIGLHGIDAWHSAEKGIQERERIVAVTAAPDLGVRMHWLCFNSQSPATLEQAGFDYDSTVGYNEAIGFKAGTTQVYRPLGAGRLLELPLHIQDTSLFYSGRMALTEAEAWRRCVMILDTAERLGGVLTVSWHQRSLAPERLWGEFYGRLLQALQSREAWFGTASQVVKWFRSRRAIVFEECRLTDRTLRLRFGHEGTRPGTRMCLRVYKDRRAGSPVSADGPAYFDLLWNGESGMDIPLE